MPLAVGDYDSFPHVWFRGKSWKKYVNVLKYGENSKYPSNYPKNFCPAVGSIGSFSLRYVLRLLRSSLFWYINAPLVGIY
jgi:hypothetical protein